MNIQEFIQITFVVFSTKPEGTDKKKHPQLNKKNKWLTKNNSKIFNKVFKSLK